MTSKASILIVEDDPGLRHVHEIFFDHQGFELTTVTNGEDALKRIEAQTYDVIILDIGLPGIDGLEVLKAIREKSDVPVIVMTARTDIQSINQVFALGANDYLNKPFRPEILLKRIEVVLADPTSKPGLKALHTAR